MFIASATNLPRQTSNQLHTNRLVISSSLPSDLIIFLFAYLCLFGLHESMFTKKQKNNPELLHILQKSDMMALSLLPA